MGNVNEVPVAHGKPSGLERFVRAGQKLLQNTGRGINLHRINLPPETLLLGQEVIPMHVADNHVSTYNISSNRIGNALITDMSAIKLGSQVEIAITHTDGKHYIKTPAAGDTPARSVELTPGILLFIGRHDSSGRSTLVIDNPTVSGEHAVIYIDPSGNEFFIEDLHSKNGTVAELTGVLDSSKETMFLG